MKTICLLGMTLAFGLAANAQEKLDALSGLPIIPAAETMVAGKSYGFQPSPMPAGTVCKSKMKGDFYSLPNMNVKDPAVKVSAVVAWYTAHLSGFKKTPVNVGKSAQNAIVRSQTAFYNAGGTVLVDSHGTPRAGRRGHGGSYAISYQKYEPGISEKTIASLTQGRIVCN